MYREISHVYASRGKHHDSDGAFAVTDFDGNVALLTIIDQRHMTKVVMTCRQAVELIATLEQVVGAAMETTREHVHGRV